MNHLSSIPPRSAIYSIEPMYKNTAEVESLHHYVYRLAREHCLNVGKFLDYCLNEQFPAQALIHNGHAAAFSTQEQLVECLEKLSGRNDLSNTTLLYYKEVISDVSLYRNHQAWCPVCLSEKNEPVYERLSWTLYVVNACIEHEQILVEKCKSCSKKQVPYVDYGFCKFCKSDLSSTTCTNRASYDELDYVEEILDIIRARRMPEIPVENSIQFLMELYDLKNQQLSKATLVNPVALSNRRKKPNLTTAVKLSSYFQLPVYKLLDNRLV
ncbi:TniQ family protein [Paenibacillus marchantiae]|uniref:TniQ family protein n=1 Tax=Paenibacillus marchantiae TaxID=3026433 RepID=UPI00237C0857|nr:TniQ family protein [Paenibacillus marchantiae]WDQ32193.1 TniQ family protein [Paenibacillus marchantiae]